MPWTLVNSWTWSSNVANVDFTGLAAYTDVRVLVRGVTVSVSGQRQLVVSTDNGSTFLTTSGDYISCSGTGVETATTAILMHTTANAGARTADVEINGFNLTALKVAQMYTRTDVNTVLIPTASALNAVRVLNSGGGNLTAGNIYVYAR